MESHLASFPVPSYRLSDSSQLTSQVQCELLVDFMQNTIEHNKTQKSTYAFDETRDVPVSHYVCQWWISQFRHVEQHNPVKTPLKFTKKHRDQVRWKSSLLPFRRSGLWMTVKTVFHIILTKHLGQDGIVIYKVLITAFLLDVIKTMQKSSESNMCPDLLVHCLRKIARRLIKIEKLVESASSFEIRQWAKSHTEKLQESMLYLMPSKNWQQMVKRQCMRNDIAATLNKLKFQDAHFQQLCTELKIYLKSTEAFNRIYCCSYNPSSNPNIFDRNELPTLSAIRCPTDITANMKLVRIELWIQFRFETWLTRVFSSTNRSANDFEQLITFFEDYQRAAIEHYCSDSTGWDPIGYSRYILTSLTIIHSLHVFLCEQKQFERLKSHRIEIPHLIEMFPYLVLPDRDDMIRARELRDYFIKFTQKSYPDLLSAIDSKTAFGVCFAANSQDMIQTLSQIQHEAQKDKENKIIEVNEAKQRCKKLMESIIQMKCECSTIPYVKCDRCDIIRKAQNIKVEIYECPIPKKIESALAVIFELQMPIEIRCYRDILWRFINRNDSETTNHMYAWLSVNPHARKLPHFYQDSYKLRIKLVSSQKSITQTHYSAPRLVGVTPLEDYLFENSLHIQISPTKPTTFDTECRYLTPQLTDFSYQCLQFAVDNTDFVQNRAIAQLSNCSLRLKPSQFIDFGSFRSGHRLQWWNLLSALELDSLSLEEESVAILIMHSLLQYGPVSLNYDLLNPSWCSESHQIILDNDFLDELLLRLKNRLVDCQDNWQSELVLLILTIIIIRLFTLCNKDRISQVLDLVMKCRQTGERWMRLINQYIQTMSSTSLIKVDVVREKLVIIAITCLLTFSTHSHRLDDLLSSDEHVISLLQAATTMYDNTVLNDKQSSRSPFLKYLIRITERLLIFIHPNVKRLIERNSFHLLNKYCALYWTELRDKSFVNGRWKKRNEDRFDGWYDGQYDLVIISIDCLTGTFLIDGMTVGFLPQSITSNALFARVFGDHVFEVQASQTREQYITKYRYHGERKIHYEFSFDDQHDRLTVYERHGMTKDKFQLIPTDCFQDELPDILVSNYSHWRNVATDQIEFRPIRFQDPNFLGEKQYVLNLNSYVITTKAAEKSQTLIRTSSTFFQSLYVRYFNRLDTQPYVYMLKDVVQTDENPMIHIHLSRLGIAFRYDMTNNKIMSREYPDMYIDQDQWFGTLTGLKSGLLLSSTNKGRTERWNAVSRKFIVPFGQVRISRSADNTNHQEVIVERSVSSNTFVHQYFVFILNDRLRILQSTDSPTGWLYLALLHAMTSHTLPDQYTGMTGMERAFQLLNSAGCWNDQPYSPLCLNILLQIASISPKASYYPEHLTSMVQLEFHSRSLPYSLQHFGYYLIAKRLFTNSEQLNFMHSSDDSGETKRFFENKKYNEKLLIKLYWDYRDSYNPIARLSEEMEKEIVQRMFTGRYEPTWYNCPSQTSYPPKSLTDGLYHSGNIHLIDNSQIKTFPLSRWLNTEYQLKNTWIGLFKTAHELEIKKSENGGNDVDRFELLLNFLHYIAIKCTIEPYYLQVLTSVLKATDVSLASVRFPAWIEYENIEETSFQPHRIKLPKKLRLEGKTKATSEIKNCYDCKIPYTNNSFPTRAINVHGINTLLESWRRNAQLRSHINAIQNAINNVPLVVLHPLKSVHPQQFTIEKFPQHYQIHLRSKKSQFDQFLFSSAQKKFCFRHTDYFIKLQPTRSIPRQQKLFPYEIFSSIHQQINPITSITHHFKEQLSESWKNYHAVQEYQYKYPSVDEVYKHLKIVRDESIECWNELKESMTESYEFAFETGSVLRITSTTLIHILQQCETERKSSVHLNQEQRTLLGGLMINWIVEQQYERALYFASHGQQEDFEKEISNTPHTNWIPEQHIPWIVMQLEMNITIRQMQVDVTKHMMQTEYANTTSTARNIVMQMNMGEGKTSVILPMLALSLCSSSSSLVRFIVLKALFPMNYQALRSKLGGLLNRRVFPFACRRDMNFTCEQVNHIHKRFQDALQRCDVVITSPEDLLSFDLLTIDKCRRSELDTSQSMLRTQHWLKRNARDVLDESDEILHVKYQLIYSVGSQKQVDAGVERWKTIQSILMLTKKHAANIVQQFPMRHSIDHQNNEVIFLNFVSWHQNLSFNYVKTSSMIG